MMTSSRTIVLGAAALLAGWTVLGQAQDETKRTPAGDAPRKQATSKSGPRPGGGLAGGMTFERMLERHDANKDGEVTKAEFKGPAELFERMDVDSDGVVTKKEFDARSGQRPGGQPASDRPDRGTPPVEPADRPREPDANSLLKLLDADQNGKVSKDEFDKFFRRADSDQDDSISGEELRKLLGAAGEMRAPPDELQAILKGREGRLKPGDVAPDFRLKRLEGSGEVQLSQVIGKRPVVLIFGSYT